MPPIHDRDQLTLEVALHCDVDPVDCFRRGALKLRGEFVCPVDLNAGDQITITIAGPDGEVIAQSVGHCLYPGFRDIIDRDEVIGVERVNQAKVH